MRLWLWWTHHLLWSNCMCCIGLIDKKVFARCWHLQAEFIKGQEISIFLCTEAVIVKAAVQIPFFFLFWLKRTLALWWFRQADEPHRCFFDSRSPWVYAINRESLNREGLFLLLWKKGGGTLCKCGWQWLASGSQQVSFLRLLLLLLLPEWDWQWPDYSAVQTIKALVSCFTTPFFAQGKISSIYLHGLGCWCPKLRWWESVPLPVLNWAIEKSPAVPASLTQIIV